MLLDLDPLSTRGPAHWQILYTLWIHSYYPSLSITRTPTASPEMNLGPIMNCPAMLRVCEENHQAILYIDLEITYSVYTSESLKTAVIFKPLYLFMKKIIFEMRNYSKYKRLNIPWNIKIPYFATLATKYLWCTSFTFVGHVFKAFSKMRNIFSLNTIYKTSCLPVKGWLKAFSKCLIFSLVWNTDKTKSP